MSDTKTKNAEKPQETIENVSFLHESQLEGKANESSRALTEKMSLDEALASYYKITNKDAVKELQTMAEEDIPTVEMRTYCHDCRQIVTPGVGQTLRGNPRTVCGVCGSKKIATGAEKALKSYYHIKKEDENAENANSKPKRTFFNEPNDPKKKRSRNNRNKRNNHKKRRDFGKKTEQKTQDKTETKPLNAKRTQKSKNEPKQQKSNIKKA